MVIKFYRTTDKYGEFSNFSKYEIKLDGKIGPTSEHYFQAQKFEDLEIQEEIRNVKMPMEAVNPREMALNVFSGALGGAVGYGSHRALLASPQTRAVYQDLLSKMAAMKRCGDAKAKVSKQEALKPNCRQNCKLWLYHSEFSNFYMYNHTRICVRQKSCYVC